MTPKIFYHVQPGETFVSKQDGKTYRYADVIPDWSPAKPGYVDVFDPSHPPDKGGGSSLTYKRTPDSAPVDTQNIPTSDTPDYTEDSKSQAEDDAPQEPKKSPLDTFKDNHPEFKGTDDGQLLSGMHARMAPDMPLDKFSDLAKLPDGASAIESELNKGLNGLQMLQRKYAGLGASDDQLYYTALNMVEAGIYNYVAMQLSGANQQDSLPKGRDYVFPRTGRDAQGRDMRVQPIEYSREWLSWHQHILSEGGYPMGTAHGSADFWSNKLQPFFQTLSQDWQNRNYFGVEIADKGDPNQMNQLADHARFWAKNLLLPIPFEGAFENTGGEYGLADVARSVAGYPRAPGWTTRTDTENRITDTYRTRFAGTKSKADADKQAAHQALRKAVLAKDQTAIAASVNQLRGMHVTDKQILRLEKEAHIPYETYMFKRLGAADQREILQQMSPEELKVYRQLAHPDVQRELARPN